MTLGPTDLPPSLAAAECSGRAQNLFRARERASAAEGEEDRAAPGGVREVKSVEQSAAAEGRTGARSFEIRRSPAAGEEHATPPPEVSSRDPEGRGRSVDVRI